LSKINFNVDAYTAKLIGRENVSKLDGAILELVKNTYDADASLCFIYYEKDTDTLYLGDNGSGMTKEIILKHWMTIGHSSKVINYKSKSGRIQTGAKGIGRFALDRIADCCDMLTISESGGLHWVVDWSTFDSGKKITDVTAEMNVVSTTFNEFVSSVKNDNILKLVKEFFPKPKQDKIKGEKRIESGTIFRLTKLRDIWDDNIINSIKNNLQTLIPPELKEIFNIYFFEQDTTIKSADLLVENDVFSYDYKIIFDVSLDGNVKVELHRDEFDFGQRFDEILSGADFYSEEKEYFKGTPIIVNSTFSEILATKEEIDNTIGDFSGTLYYAKLNTPRKEQEKYFYKDITGRHDLRDSFGGIRIYRDGFRVRPYGDPKSSSSDWLMLAARKNKSPAAISHKTGAWRVNADQMLGSVYISRTNLYLPDQANREGIVETKEFAILRDFILNVIKLFERDRQKVCRILNDYYDMTHPTSEFEEELLKKAEEDKKNQEQVKTGKKESYTPASMEVSKVSELLGKKQATIEELETELQLLRVLATTGIITNTYVHEIKGLTHRLNLKIILAKEALEFDRDLDTALAEINIANNLRETFSSWFKVTIDSVKRDKRKMQKINTKYLMDKLVASWREILTPKGITIYSHSDDIDFKCFPYEIESIFNNLITNSVTSFEQKTFDEKKININLKLMNEFLEISYNDNGVGLSNKYKNDPYIILEPFESDKAIGDEIVGTGMGMWIINRIVNDYNGMVNLEENVGKDIGFHIKILLNSR